MPRIHITHEVKQLLTELLDEEITAASPADPFLIDHDCRNPAGHDFIASCGQVVWSHCSRIAWQ